MGQPIVLQLQELASDSVQDIADLLRRALVVATKLRLSEFRGWILSELNGYKDLNALPEYRRIRGDLRAQNPYHGLIPFIIQESEIRDVVSKILVRESVSSIQQLVDSSKDGSICFFFGPEQEAALMRMQGDFAALRPMRVVGPNQLLGILQSVRTRILEWSLSLEAEGILGDGLSFSEQEQRAALSSRSIRIENFQGVLGDVHGGSIAQINSLTVQSGNFDSLAKYLLKQGVSKADVSELERAIREDPEPKNAQTFGTKVSAWIGKMVSKAASGGWEVTVATAGTLLAAAIAKFYGL